MNQIKVWPHLTIVAILVALVAGLGTAFYFKHEQTAQAEALPNAARIQRVDGEVAFNNAAYTNGANAQNTDQANTQWVRATANQPFSVGDRIYTRENSHASLAFTGRNFARLNPNTNLDVLELSDSRTQLALRDGSAIFDVGYLAPNELYEVGTPYGAVDFLEPGLYNVGFDNNNNNVLISALSGVAQVVGLGGSGRIGKGEMLTLAATAAAQVALASLNHNDAGYLVDDYYRYQYPSVYDGRYSNYDAYLNDPYYYDPYRRDVSYQYAPSFIPGLNDLDYYGDWVQCNDYGHCWRPRVDASWVPYQDGYWTNDYPYGPTWVSNEAWGYAPYHYGRWITSGNQWFWVPDPVNSTPYYSPALVAFVPFTDSSMIGWVPLGPGDPYAPRYYDASWQPYYLTRTNVVTTQLVNLRVPNAVTVIPVDSFGQPIDRRMVRQADMQQLAQVRAVLDPLTLTPLRNAVVHSAWGRGKIDLPPGIAKKLNDTTVLVGNVPAPPFRRDLAKALRVEPLPDKVKNQKLNFRDDRRAAANPAQIPGQGQPQAIAPADDQARKAEMARLAAESARGNRDARKQMQQLQQEQRKQEVEAQRAARQAEQQPQGQRVGEPARRQPETEVMRPQRVQPEPRKAAPVSPRIDSPRIRPETRVRPEPPRAAPRPQPQPRVQPQPRQPAPQQQAAPKHEARQPAQPQAQPAAQPQGQGKGKGKKP